ncbi:MAG: hypothetical protein JNJ63_07355 [Hyphomonadaceae bacterium]|nr:hypothetical protein [Hyphomonadaceae bacterium]
MGAPKIDTKWIQSKLTESGSSIASLARDLGRDRASISRIVNGEQPWQPWMTPIVAARLGVPDLELLTRVGLLDARVATAPLLPWFAAGLFAMGGEKSRMMRGRDHIIVPDMGSDTLVAFEVADASLERTLPTGSVIVIDYCQKTLSDWDIGVFAFGNGAHLRRYRIRDGRSWLVEERLETTHDDWITTEGTATVGKVIAIPKLGSFQAGEHPHVR